MSEFKHDMKPCPFCGATAHNGNGVMLNTIELAPNRYAVVCTCGANGSIENSKAQARKAWNTRNSLDDFFSWNPFGISEKAVCVEFKGSIDSINLSSILQFFYTEKKTGILQITRERKRAAICLKRGNVIAASCNWGLQLGQILRDKNLISKEILKKSLDKAKTSGKSMGEVLLSLENISPDALLQAIRYQIDEVVREALFWKEGCFLYRDYNVDFNQRGVEEISTIAIILEASVRNDELDAA
jgi:Lar family restriction alleviation protein